MGLAQKNHETMRAVKNLHISYSTQQPMYGSKVKFWSGPLRVVRVVPFIPSQIPWIIEPGVADGAASGRFGLMRDIQ